MTPRSPTSSAPWLLAGPGALFFIGLVLLPLALTVILSFHAYDHSSGIQNTFTLSHYVTVLTDGYYLEIFWRTLRIAALTTIICAAIGVPEAYILSRMRDPWRSVFLLVIIGPLLVSVVVRAFGWSILLGSSGLVVQLGELRRAPATLTCDDLIKSPIAGVRADDQRLQHSALTKRICQLLQRFLGEAAAGLIGIGIDAFDRHHPSDRRARGGRQGLDIVRVMAHAQGVGQSSLRHGR